LLDLSKINGATKALVSRLSASSIVNMNHLIHTFFSSFSTIFVYSIIHIHTPWVINQFPNNFHDAKD
jgi:hypothetical protein